MRSAQRLWNELNKASREEAATSVDIALQPPIWERALNGNDLADVERDGIGCRGVVLVRDLRLQLLLRPRRRNVVAYTRLAVEKRYVRAICNALGDNSAEVIL